MDSRIIPYLVKYPYISNKIGEQPDGNPHVYLGVWISIKNIYDSITNYERLLVSDTFLESINSSGMLTRGSHKINDFCSHDEYLGIVTASVLTQNYLIITNIYNRAQSNDWILDNTGKAPWIKRWGIRVSGTVQHIKLAHRTKLNIFDQLIWAINVAFNRDESGIQKSWLMIQVYKSQTYRYSICNWAMRHFDAKLWLYDGLMGGVFKKYFGESHLFTKLMWGKK